MLLACFVRVRPAKQTGKIKLMLVNRERMQGESDTLFFSSNIPQLVGGLEHLDYFSIILGMSSSQLTFIFFRGVGLNHQPDNTFFKIVPSGYLT